ncbi:PTS transporter subunit EIIC, partial [Streptococcus agalactiae]|uniref:PTS transporter subunit EIIC n=1 Tax=Streptococcus agalactiae TaxID=1311 RepID=UPI00113DB420
SIGVSYRLAEKYNVDALGAAAISLAAFMLATPYNVPFTPPGSEETFQVGGAIPVLLTGSRGLFVAIILAVISTEIFRKIVQKDLVIKLPENVPPAVSRSFTALFPALVILSLVWVTRLLIELTSFESIHNVI